MGLCVVSNLVKKFGGDFIIRSKQDGHEMTCFEIRLPFGDHGQTKSSNTESKRFELLTIIE